MDRNWRYEYRICIIKYHLQHNYSRSLPHQQIIRRMEVFETTLPATSLREVTRLYRSTRVNSTPAERGQVDPHLSHENNCCHDNNWTSNRCTDETCSVQQKPGLPEDEKKQSQPCPNAWCLNTIQAGRLCKIIANHNHQFDGNQIQRQDGHSPTKHPQHGWDGCSRLCDRKDPTQFPTRQGRGKHGPVCPGHAKSGKPWMGP